MPSVCQAVGLYTQRRELPGVRVASRERRQWNRTSKTRLGLRGEVGGEYTWQRNCPSKIWGVGRKRIRTWAWNNICKLCFGPVALGWGSGAAVESGRL